MQIIKFEFKPREITNSSVILRNCEDLKEQLGISIFSVYNDIIYLLETDNINNIKKDEEKTPTHNFIYEQVKKISAIQAKEYPGEDIFIYIISITDCPNLIGIAASNKKYQK